MTELSDDALSGTTKGIVVDPGTGEEYEATFKDLTDEEQRELENLEKQVDEGDAEAAVELQKKIINDYCLDDVTYANNGVASRQAIVVGFMRALGDQNEATKEAEEFFDSMEAAQGNP